MQLNNPKFIIPAIFLTKNFVESMTVRIFVTSVSTKPLKDAQMCGLLTYAPFYE